MNIPKSTTYRDLWTGDFDKDRVANIDDEYPFDDSKKKRVNKEVSLSKSYKNLERTRKKYDKDIKKLARKVKATSFRVKDQYSTIGKQIGRNLETAEDMGGLRILTKDRKTVYKKLDYIKKVIPKCSKSKKNNCIKEIDDKYKVNKRNKFKNPYMAVHVNVKYNKKPYEIQIKSAVLQPIQDATHPCYKRNNLKCLRELRKKSIKLYKKGY